MPTRGNDLLAVIEKEGLDSFDVFLFHYLPSVKRRLAANLPVPNELEPAFLPFAQDLDLMEATIGDGSWHKTFRYRNQLYRYGGVVDEWDGPVLDDTGVQEVTPASKTS